MAERTIPKKCFNNSSFKLPAQCNPVPISRLQFFSGHQYATTSSNMPFCSNTTLPSSNKLYHLPLESSGFNFHNETFNNNPTIVLQSEPESNIQTHERKRKISGQPLDLTVHNSKRQQMEYNNHNVRMQQLPSSLSTNFPHQNINCISNVLQQSSTCAKINKDGQKSDLHLLVVMKNIPLDKLERLKLCMYMVNDKITDDDHFMLQNVRLVEADMFNADKEHELMRSALFSFDNELCKGEIFTVKFENEWYCWLSSLANILRINDSDLEGYFLHNPNDVNNLRNESAYANILLIHYCQRFEQKIINSKLLVSLKFIENKRKLIEIKEQICRDKMSILPIKSESLMVQSSVTSVTTINQPKIDNHYQFNSFGNNVIQIDKSQCQDGNINNKTIIFNNAIGQPTISKTQVETIQHGRYIDAKRLLPKPSPNTLFTTISNSTNSTTNTTINANINKNKINKSSVAPDSTVIDEPPKPQSIEFRNEKLYFVTRGNLTLVSKQQFFDKFIKKLGVSNMEFTKQLKKAGCIIRNSNKPEEQLLKAPEESLQSHRLLLLSDLITNFESFG